MAHKACSKSGDEKQPARFAPRIGEYVLRSSEVVKLSKTLQERIVTVAHTSQNYNFYTTAYKDYDHHKKTELLEALCDARAKADKVLQETFDALVGLYGAMTSPPVGFNEVAVALMGVVGTIKGVSEKGISQILDIVPAPKGVLSFLSPLDIATNQLHARVSEVTQRLFDFIPSTISNIEYSNDGSSPADSHKRYSDRMLAVAARYGLDIKKMYWNNNRSPYEIHWLYVFDVLQENDPDAPEWIRLYEESEGCDTYQVEDFVEKSVLLYLERKDDERIAIENDANYQQQVKAFISKLRAMQRRIKADSQTPKQPKEKGKKQHSNSAFLIICELAKHHQISKKEPYTEPHTVRSIHKSLGENIKSTSTVSDFFKKHFKEPDGTTSGYAVYAKWCKTNWSAVIGVLNDAIELKSRDLTVRDTESRQNIDRREREHRDDVKSLDAHLDAAR